MAIKDKNILREYFESGDKPTQQQFRDLIDSLSHKNEIIPEFIISRGKDYANFEYTNAAGLTPNGKAYYLDIKINEGIDFNTMNPKFIIYRYKPKRRKPGGIVKPAGWYHEKPEDAVLNHRISEIEITQNNIKLDIKPQHYFKKHEAGNYSYYYPTGYQVAGGKWTKKGNKSYIYLQIRLQVNILGKLILSPPKTVRLLHEFKGLYTYELINI